MILKSRPTRVLQANNSEIVEAPMPEKATGELLVRNQYLSVDPAMRGWVTRRGRGAKPTFRRTRSCI